MSINDYPLLDPTPTLSDHDLEQLSAATALTVAEFDETPAECTYVRVSDSVRTLSIRTEPLVAGLARELLAARRREAGPHV